MFFASSRSEAAVRQYCPVRCHLLLRAPPLRAGFARHLHAQFAPTALVTPSELPLTVQYMTLSHVISCKIEA